MGAPAEPVFRVSMASLKRARLPDMEHPGTIDLRGHMMAGADVPDGLRSNIANRSLAVSSVISIHMDGGDGGTG